MRFLLIALLAAFYAVAPAAAQEGPAAGLSQSQAQALADVLKDDQARAALVAELERMGGQSAGDAMEEAQPETPKRRSFGRIVAETTQGAAEAIAVGAERFWRQLKSAPRLFDGLSGDEAAVLWEAFLDLALVIVVTVGAFFLFRSIGKRIDRRIGRAAEQAYFIKKVGYVASSLTIDVIVVLLAWAVGYGVAAIAVGQYGEVGILQALYLNAYLVVELVKVGVRTVLSPTSGGLRPIALPDDGARRLNVWVSVVVSVLGYGQLLIVPILNDQVTWFAGQAAGIIVSLIAILMLAAMVSLNRSAVMNWLLEARHMAAGSPTQRFVARNWHWPVLIYLLALFLIVLTRPGAVLLPVLGASAQILGAIILGAMAANGISKSIQNGLHLPADVNRKLPLLETRLNMFVPKALSLARVVIILAVAAFALHTIGVFDLRAWLESEFGAAATAAIFSVIFIIVVAFLAWLALTSWIDYRLNADYGVPPTARERTLLTLLKNAASIVIVAVTAMFALSELGIDIAPLIASAGVLGLAIGFGAQKLVQDIITGVFIQFENAMNVGDVVQVGGTTGTVERLTIRSVSLRDLHGVFHIIPFSSVDMVSNYMRGFAHYVCDMGIAYREDIDEAKQAMYDAFAELRESEDHKFDILEDMTWFGLQTFGDSAIVLRSRIKCAPGKQWAVGRAYNAILKRVFDERGIEIPFPHQTIYFGEDKNGKAPVAHVALSREGALDGDGAPTPPKADPAS